MTEAEWMNSTDLFGMLLALGGEVSDSKLRLFACACCRRIWDILDADLHHRAVEYAEWFARDPGSNLLWLGTGHAKPRRLSCPPKQIRLTEGWKEIHRALRAEQSKLWKEHGFYCYSNWTPVDVAASTLHLRYEMPWSVSWGVAALRTAPFAYWQHRCTPELNRAEEEQWATCLGEEMAQHCDLFRQVYGRPNLAQR